MKNDRIYMKYERSYELYTNKELYLESRQQVINCIPSQYSSIKTNNFNFTECALFYLSIVVNKTNFLIIELVPRNG